MRLPRLLTAVGMARNDSRVRLGTIEYYVIHDILVAYRRLC